MGDHHDLPATFEYRRVYGMGDITNQKRTYGLGYKQLRELNPQKTNRLKLPSRNGDWATKIGGRQRNSPKHGAWTPKMGTPKNQKMGGSTARGIGKKLGFSQGILRPGPGASGGSLRGRLELRAKALVGAAGGAGSGSWSCRGATSRTIQLSESINMI